MTPLASLDATAAARVLVVAFDLDDTLLTHGMLLPSVYGALARLAEAGIALVAVTGRPLGYGEVLARLLAIDGVVVENGSLSVRREGHALLIDDPVDADEREARRKNLERVAEAVFAAVPEVRFSDDMRHRHTELTFDIGENHSLPEPRVAQVMNAIVQQGAWTTRSSVHVHATFDRGNKAEGLLRFVRRHLPRAPKLDAGAWRQRVLFVGDSGNDAACFSGFPLSVGVANVVHARRSLTLLPRYVTRAEKGLGFLELAEHLLSLRQGSTILAQR